MNRFVGAPAWWLALALGLSASVFGCDDAGPSELAAGATGGLSAGRGGAGAAGLGGGSFGGGSGSAAGDSGVECEEDGDCPAFDVCYAAACEEGACVGSLMARGSACADGLCNGFGRCLPCLDDHAGKERDPGCSAESPVCSETALHPECGACEEDADCNDGVECTKDRCASSECENVPLALGRSCSGGMCNGEAGEDSCGPCVDDKSAGADAGCTPDQPVCDTSVSPRACAGCRTALDCDDDNDCTAESCTDGVCERATLVSGAPCSMGYCNGVPGNELCIYRPCQIDGDCDDHAGCTGEVCESGFCVYTPDDAECPDSGDVCRPNLCTVGTGCQVIERTRSLELLANGNLDSGNVAWSEMSVTYSKVIFPFDYVPTLLPHTAYYIGWLGGGESMLDDLNQLSQEVLVPEGAVRLELSFFYQIWTDDLPDDQNYLEVRLMPNEEPLVTFHNQDETRVWTRFSTTIDAADFADSVVELEFKGAAVGGFTNFFVDTISLVATVCE